MTSFSVKKPFTVFVAVVAILVFGVMSYVKMTPDLMPNMDYPYVVVVTTYPGAAPEEVEAVVTKPMEQSMATLNDIKTVTSTSAENYSMLVLEFEQSTNMDSAVVDILQKTQMLTGRWDDSIGTPSIIRINPNMIPVMVAAVDSSEMDRYELSRFAKDTVIPTLEGTTGVASITTGGMIERTMTIEVNEAKLDKMNAKIAEAIDKAMEDARKQLEDAQKELDENREKVEAGTNQLLSASSGISDSIKQGEDDLADTLTAAGETAAKLASARAAIDALNALPCERVYITSADGLRLTGRYYPAKPGAPLVIACHGYRGTPSRDFSVGAEIYRSMGCALLLIEERGQCGSAGHTITFGAMEKYDVLLWTRWAAERFGGIPILLGGISMGAATVLMASALGLPENVRGVIADCPYTSAKDIICSVGRDSVVPMELLYPFVRLSAKLFGHADLAQADALSAVKSARVPILLIHGEDDRFVPCDMSRAIAAANPEKIEFHTFPGAGHGLSCLVDMPRYEALVKAFAARTIFAKEEKREEL